MITNRIEKRKVLLPINRNYYNFRKQQRSLVETMSKVKKIKNKNKIKKKKLTILEILQLFLG